jgi:hypothetical protein
MRFFRLKPSSASRYPACATVPDTPLPFAEYLPAVLHLSRGFHATKTLEQFAAVFNSYSCTIRAENVFQLTMRQWKRLQSIEVRQTERADGMNSQSSANSPEPPSARVRIESGHAGISARGLPNRIRDVLFKALPIVPWWDSRDMSKPRDHMWPSFSSHGPVILLCSSEIRDLSRSTGALRLFHPLPHGMNRPCFSHFCSQRFCRRALIAPIDPGVLRPCRVTA